MDFARLPSLVRNPRAWLGTLAGALMLATLGCSYGITVRRAAGNSLFNSWRASVTETDDLSPRTRQTIRQWDLEAQYQDDPAAAYARLQQEAVKDPQPDLLFALAELSYLFAHQAEKEEGGRACAFYYLCAGYAYHFLFDDPGQPGNPFDPRFRVACDLYNNGLAKCVRAAQSTGRLDPRQQLVLPTPDGRGFTLSVVHHGFPWQPEEFGPFLFCDDYEVVGLANRYRGYGLGVALIGTRVGSDGETHRHRDTKTTNSAVTQVNLAVPGGKPADAFYPDEVSFPITAFFRFEGTVGDLAGQRAGRLELYNPLVTQTVDVRGKPIPLETDLTTPLAYFLSRTDLQGIEVTGLLRADKVQERAGVYMFEPYQPGKIPVLMVHGLLSSPLTWTTMFNDLRSDPTLRHYFQFWFYLYPTGNSYLATAADLRRSLARLRAEVDPQGRDPALDQMVLVGHSMGGLVSKLLTVDSGDDFWHLGSTQSFDALKIQPETREELHNLFYFQPQPFIRRVIFIGTPHHGSKLSPSAPAQLASKFIHLPRQLIQAAGDLSQQDPQIKSLVGDDGPIGSSIDLLAPKAPALELLAARPRPQGVHYHSIIGDAFGKGEDGTDGVVPYRSAHLDGVDSEIVVPAGHTSVHQHPRAILEVWRILLEHLREVEGQAAVPLSPPPRELPNRPDPGTDQGTPGIMHR